MSYAECTIINLNKNCNYYFMRKLLLSISLLLVSIGLFAQHRSEQEAMQIARGFFAKNVRAKSPKLKFEQSAYTASSAGRRAAQTNNGFYVVNDEANNRFVIVSADERMFEILGYSDNGVFDVETAPLALFELFDEYNRQYELIGKSGDILKTNVKQAQTQVVEPFIKAKWGQSSPYNLQCPEASDGSQSVTGCVATAMAMVMNHYHYPNRGTGGSVTYKTSTVGTYQNFNFNSLTIDWNNILDEYDKNCTQDQKDEVAKLMHACGVSVFMDYDKSSGAYSEDIAYAMINYFGYNPNMVLLKKNYYKSEEWNDIIMEELVAGRPILYSGQGTGGHQFILDGTDGEGRYHINFGWSGSCNGYFSVDAINPVEGIEFGGQFFPIQQHDYSSKQSMVVGVSPEASSEAMDVFIADEFTLAESADIAQRTNLKFKVYCNSNKANTKNALFDGVYGLGVFDKDWNYVKSLFEQSAKLRAGYGTSQSTYVRFDSNTFSEGSQYYVALYAQHKDNPKMTRMRTPLGERDWYRVTVKNDKVYLAPDSLITDTIIPPVPIPEGLVGTFDVSDQNGTKWKVEVTKHTSEEGTYIFSGIDPALAKKGLTPNQNKVTGVMYSDGNIRIGNQQIDGSLWFNNFTSTDSIIVRVNRTDSQYRIDDTWGTYDKAAAATVSQYSVTTFQYSEAHAETLATPSILIDNEHRVQISCTTEGADIYYSVSQNGAIPETPYTGPFVLQGNGIIKAVAKKDGKTSEIATEKVSSFVVDRPKIVVDGENNVSMSCNTNGALIFFTTNGERPTSKNGTLYEKSIPVAETTTFMAVAVKENWNDSEIDTCMVVIIPEPIVVADNTAGHLSERIGYKDKTTATSLTVSGQLNGSDIKLIREMINDYRLAYIDLKDASIVAGGEPYYSSSYSAYSTENDVIGQYMFYNCKGLISIVLPATATKISYWAFRNCSELTLVELPKACVTVEDDVFYGNKNLTTLHLPKTVTEFGSNNLNSCRKFEAFTVEEGNTSLKAIDGVLYKNDTTLVKYPMGRNSTEFTIPATVKRIENHAFSYAMIESVKLLESLKHIGNYCFSNCEKLKDILLGNSVTTFGNSVFWGCKQLEDVTLPESIEKIPSTTFYNCVSLRSINIGQNIKDIADDAFENCTMLQSFAVDENNQVFVSEGGILYTKDMKTLWRCPLALYSEELRLPESVVEIYPNAFDDCINIAKLILGPNVKRIGNSAFSNCKMTAIYLPESVESIGSMAFWGCSNLETFVVPVNMKKVSANMFYNCKNLSYVYLPRSINTFEDDAFHGCTSLTYVNSKIKDIENVEVYYSTYSQKYTVFDNLPDTCTWRIPAGPADDVEKYARKYKEQPWWTETWRISIDTDVEPQIITLSSDLVTYCSSEDIDFTDIEGLKAYIASGFNPTTGEVVMSRVNIVPANTGLLLVGTEGQSYEVPITDTDFIYSNLLRGVLEDVNVTSGYVLSGNQFVAISGEVTVKAGEAYLNIMPEVSANAPRLSIHFSDTSTLGIEGVHADETSKNGSWYTLQGARLEGKPTKRGIYLHQGRKVVVK